MKPVVKALICTAVVVGIWIGIDYLPEKSLKPLTNILFGTICIGLLFGIFHLLFSPTSYRPPVHDDVLEKPKVFYDSTDYQEAKEHLDKMKQEWKDSGSKQPFLTYYLEKKQKQ